MNQIENLTPNHKPLKIRGQMSFDWGVLYTIEKNFLKAIKYYRCIFQNILDLRKIWTSKVLKQQESQRKVTFGCSPHEEAQNKL
jgi:hypothetical protein